MTATNDTLVEPEMEVIKTDFYLKLASEADMETVLHDFYKQGEGDTYFVPNTPDYAVDVVGTLYDQTAEPVTTEDGLTDVEMTALDGWHVNIRLLGDAMRETVEALDTLHGVEPEVPRRIWL